MVFYIAISIGRGCDLIKYLIAPVLVREMVLKYLPHIINDRDLLPLFIGIYITPVLRMSK